MYIIMLLLLGSVIFVSPWLVLQGFVAFFIQKYLSSLQAVFCLVRGLQRTKKARTTFCVRPMVDRPRSFNIKVSPACEACNVKKIKCDRGFPVCNTCLKRGTQCKYNFEKYSNSAAKDQIIFDLEREVEYWRSKSLGAVSYTHLDVYKRQIQQFLNNIVHPPETSENPAEKLLARIMEMNNKGIFIEDTCANLQYSEPLLELAHKLEELLPPLPSISIYMKHFYQEIYPLYPFAEISLIEESINNVLWPDPNNNFRVKLNLGQFEIRRKIMELVLLILCLKISETSIKVTLLHPCPGELSEHDYLLLKMIRQNPVSTEIFYLSFSCLAYLDVFQCTSENMVCYYLYLWVFFIITPERPDILVDQSSDTIACLLYTSRCV